MNDFLQSLRNGTLKRQDRNRKNYDKPQYRNGERGGNRDKRSGHMNKPLSSGDMGEIKKMLQGLSDNAELARIAQERSAEALERIARSLQAMTPAGQQYPETAQPVAPVPEIETASSTETPVAEDNANTPSSDDSRAGTTAVIQNMKDNGSSFEAIARHLNDQGVPTFSGKGEWRAQNVSRAYNAARNQI